MRWTRREWLAATALTGLGGAAYVRFVEPRWLEVKELDVPLKGPPRGLRILQLSDLHLSSVVSLDFLESAIDRGLACAPDLICLTGDYVTAGDGADLPRLGPGLQRLARAAPTYACLGNHDGGRWSAGRGGEKDTSLIERVLHEAGVRLLQNHSAEVQVRQRRVRVRGLEDLWAGRPDPGQAWAAEEESSGPRSAEAQVDLQLVLSHNPDSKRLLEGRDFDLMLCGHTHGGQLRLPLLGAPFAPVHDRRYVAGLNDWQGRWIHTSRGVGNLHGVRLGCRPELSVLRV